MKQEKVGKIVNRRKDIDNLSGLTKAIRESIAGLGSVLDVTQTLRDFDKLLFKKPKIYSSKDIVRLRRKKLKMSQAVFAIACNVKLPTLQKWESGYSNPTPPVQRLFQLIEKDGLNLIKNAA